MRGTFDEMVKARNNQTVAFREGPDGPDKPVIEIGAPPGQVAGGLRDAPDKLVRLATEADKERFPVEWAAFERQRRASRAK